MDRVATKKVKCRVGKKEAAMKVGWDVQTEQAHQSL